MTCASELAQLARDPRLGAVAGASDRLPHRVTLVLRCQWPVSAVSPGDCASITRLRQAAHPARRPAGLCVNIRVLGGDWTGVITEEYCRITVDEPADPEFLSIWPVPTRLCRPARIPGYRAFRRGGWPVTDVRYPDTVINDVPVVATPAEIDITNAEGLQSALFKAAANGHRTLVVDMTQTQVLRLVRAAHPDRRAQESPSRKP